MRRALIAGVLYFTAVFAAGFVLGVLRTVLLEPVAGPTVAVLIELPVILTVAWLVCARILDRLPLTAAGAGAMGAAAFLLLMLGETGVSLLLAGRDLSGHLALYAQTAHLLGLAGQAAFALLPLIRVLAKREAIRR